MYLPYMYAITYTGWFIKHARFYNFQSMHCRKKFCIQKLRGLKGYIMYCIYFLQVEAFRIFDSQL